MEIKAELDQALGKKDLRIKTESKVYADKTSYDKVKKKYKGASGEIDKFVEQKSKFYSEKLQEELEIFGFENGEKWEYMAKITDSILLFLWMV